MHRRQPRGIVGFLLLQSLALLGCQQTSDTPTQPAAIPVAASHQQSTGQLSLMAADVLIAEGPGGLTATMTPIRATQAEPPLGATAVVDIMGYVAGSLSCHDCLTIERIGRPAPDVVEVTFGLTHPFGAETGRWDYHLFDVRGHIAGSQPSWEFPGIAVDLGGVMPESAHAELFMLNADGYTSFVDGVVVPSLGLNRNQVNLRPYKLFWRDFSAGNYNRANPHGFADLANPSGHNVFPVGGKASDPRSQATYRFTFPENGARRVAFRISLDGFYGKSSLSSNPSSAKYFLPLFHQTAPILVETTITENHLQAADPQSQAQLEIRIVDWQTDVNAKDGEPFDWELDPLNTTLRESSPSSVRIDVPGILSAPITRTRVSNNGGIGTYDDPLLFRQAITNTAAGSLGRYYGCVAVKDSLGTFPAELPLVVERTGYTLSDWTDFTTYQVFSLEVAEVTNLSPIAVLEADRTEIQSLESVHFCPGPGTVDPDGTILRWEYDFDFDPNNPDQFDVEEVRTSADPDQCVDHVFTTFGQPNQVIYSVGMRVVDDGVPERYGFDDLKITVNP